MLGWEHLDFIPFLWCLILAKLTLTFWSTLFSSITQYSNFCCIITGLLDGLSEIMYAMALFELWNVRHYYCHYHYISLWIQWNVPFRLFLKDTEWPLQILIIRMCGVYKDVHIWAFIILTCRLTLTGLAFYFKVFNSTKILLLNRELFTKTWVLGNKEVSVLFILGDKKALSLMRCVL